VGVIPTSSASLEIAGRRTGGGTKEVVRPTLPPSNFSNLCITAFIFPFNSAMDFAFSPSLA